MAEDLRRFLDDEPILARRTTVAERYWRWARRNPIVAVLGGVLTGILVVVTAVSRIVAGRMTYLADQAMRAADLARDAQRRAAFAQTREARERVRAETARKAAEKSSEEAMAALKKAEERYAQARGAVNEYLTAVSDAPRLKVSALTPLRAQLLQSALVFYRQFLKEKADDPALQRELADVYYKVGAIFEDLGQEPSANQSFMQSRRMYEVLLTVSPADRELQDGLARALLHTGEYDRAIAIWEKLIRPDDPRYLADLGTGYSAARLRAGIARARRRISTISAVQSRSGSGWSAFGRMTGRLTLDWRVASTTSRLNW